MVGYSWDRGTLFPCKGLKDPHETHHVSPIDLEVSADSQWLIVPS